ncbi:glycosyl transferase group 1 [Xylanimonas cellulosilytica DSM 15894]|uniref:Glycosyl transferase group 1 n=2 Tax=Xylanimonas TaxID=186188 RepID=D1BXR0_XYLCX|nr:glycosyl transferase group 1 [Xylanimonas cellulosilytica DSM 15894]
MTAVNCWDAGVESRPPTVLVVPNTVFFPPYLEELPALAADGSTPRTWICDLTSKVTVLDQRLLTLPSRARRSVYSRLPMWVVQVLEVFRVGRRYDVIFCWGVANVALVLAVMLRLTGRRITVVALLTRVSESKKARLLRVAHPGLAKIVLPPVVQREYAVAHLGVPAEKLVGLPWTLDLDFWRSTPDTERVTICAAGGEMRDYRTLIRALEGLDIPCHIAGSLDLERRDWWNDDVEDQRTSLPPNITLGPMSATDLRDLYDRSRFVVVPLRPTNSDNGITCMNEAWAMGRAVIVSAVEGQRDAFEHGQHGEWVPVGDVEALRDAIVRLWNDPERTAAMGARGRELVDPHKSNAVFSAGMDTVLSAAAQASLGTSRVYRPR